MTDDKHFECTLSPDARMKDCRGCEGCGWEATEAERRSEHLKKHGLTLCADGLRRLIIKKEKNMATPYKECLNCGAHLDSGETCDCSTGANKEMKTEDNSNDGN